MTHRGAHPDGVLVQALCRCSATQRWAASAITGSVMVTSAACGLLPTQVACLPPCSTPHRRKCLTRSGRLSGGLVATEPSLSWHGACGAMQCTSSGAAFAGGAL